MNNTLNLCRRFQSSVLWGITGLLSLSISLWSPSLWANEDGYRLPAVSNAKWQQECSACHMLYHPNLLPARSWIAIMDNLDHHFNENAQLSKESAQEIKQFLIKNSADQNSSSLAHKINRSIDPDTTPLRFSTTIFFQLRHDELPPSIYKRQSIGSASNCRACHKNAEKGLYSEDDVKIPK